MLFLTVFTVSSCQKIISSVFLENLTGSPGIGKMYICNIINLHCVFLLFDMSIILDTRYIYPRGEHVGTTNDSSSYITEIYLNL